jgi:hypothetical protein
VTDDASERQPAAAAAAGVRRRRRRGARVLVAAALALTAGCGGSERKPSDKPHGLGDGTVQGIDSSRASLPQAAGKPFVYGLPIVVNTDTHPVTLERIGVKDLPAGLEVLHTYVVGPERKYAQAVEYRWPSPQHYKGIKPVRGYILPPRTEGNARLGVQLVYVMRAAKPATYKFDAVTVDYRVDDEQHRAVVPNGLRACIRDHPLDLHRDSCSPAK